MPVMPFAPCLAFVDVETTGISPQRARITEIAVVSVAHGPRGWQAHSWSTLIDPGEPIPPEIRFLTGITETLLQGAPRFEAIAEQLRDRLDGALFVAHLARFDYAFVRAEMARAGVPFAARTLCTVRLSRALDPQAPSHSLDAIVARWGLDAPGRHRALGDAQALWAFTQALAARHGEPALRAAAGRLLRHPGLPAQLGADALEAVPKGPGVYAMLGEHGQPLYVGRSRDLRRRVASHFSVDPGRARAVALAAETHRLAWQRTAGDFGARLLEGQWIRERQPSHNLAQRRRQAWALRLATGGVRPQCVPTASLAPGDEAGCHGPFGSRAAARAALSEAATAAGLCLAVLGLERRRPGEACFRRQLGRCTGACTGALAARAHAEALRLALDAWRIPPWPFAGPIAIVEAAPEGGAHWHVFAHWRHLGTGPDEAAARSIAAALRPAPTLEPEVYRLLRARLAADSAIIPLDAPLSRARLNRPESTMSTSPAAPSASSAADARVPQDGLSLVRGDTAVALLELTIPAFLARAVAAGGDREAVVFREQAVRWSWREFAQRVDELAAALLAIGVARGDRVGIWSPNRFEWVVTQFATARIGAVLVNINPAYRLAELEYALNKVETTAIITADRFKTSDYLGMLQTLAPELAHCAPGALRSARLPHLRSVVRMGDEPTPGMFNYGALLAMAGPAEFARLDPITAALAPHDPINIQFTSGTTGSPKGATLTHHNVVNNGRFIAQAMRLGPTDRLCIPVPLYHCFGMVLGVLACVTEASSMVFPGEGFDPVATMRAVSEERCTALHGVPTMFIAQLDHPDFPKHDFRSLRTGIMAGAPCPIETMKRVVSEMHMTEVTIAYGMTETSPVSFQSATDDPLEKRVSTVGRIQPHLEVKVIDADGRLCPVGVKGELCTRGYSVMQGYWNDEARTRDTVRDGWMHTGDLATIDAEGYCNIVGRVKDMLIRGGENVYPREIEEFLYRHPKVQDVQVFGVPDPKFGEEVACWVVLKAGQQATEEEVRDFCRGQIAHYKIPRYVRFVAELPMTVTGKPQKFVMREAMVRELGLAEQKTA